MAKDRSEEYKKRSIEDKKKTAREVEELARLRKELDDFVEKHERARTASGARYEKQLKKLQDAIDEFYAGTKAGYQAARKKARMQTAAAESVKIETEIEALRDTSGRPSRTTKRKIEELEAKAVEARKRARGVNPRDEARNAKKRSEVTEVVTKLRRELEKAMRERQAESVTKLEKDLTKAERRLERLEANERRTEGLDDMFRQLYAHMARAGPNTMLERDVENLGKALAAYVLLKRSDTTREEELLKNAFAEAEGARCGGGRLEEAVKKALEAMEPSKDKNLARKRVHGAVVAQRVEDATSQLEAVRRRRCADDDDVKEAEEALENAKRQQSHFEACGERSTVQKKYDQELDAIEKTRGGGSYRAKAVRAARDALNVFGRQQRPVSEKETDALDKMIDELKGSGPGIMNRCAEATAAVVKASATQRWDRAKVREAAARDVADLEAELDALPDRDDVDHDEEERAKIEDKLEKAKARVSKLERNDEWTKAAEEVSRRLQELEVSGTGDAAYKQSIEEAKTVLTQFRGRLGDFFDLSEAEAKLRDMLLELEASTGRTSEARTARDAAVTKAREALMTNDEIATACVRWSLKRLEEAPAVYAYNQVKGVASELPLDVGKKLAYALSRTAITEASDHVAALEHLLEDFGRLSPADRCELGGLADEATEVLELVRDSIRIRCVLDKVEEALSRLDNARNALRAPPGKAAAFDRFYEAGTKAGTALGIATALRYYKGTYNRMGYDRIIEAATKLHDEWQGFKATDGSGSAWDEELRRREDAYKAAYAKTPTGKRRTAFEALVRGTAATRRLLTDNICDRARVVVDHGHVVCEEMREKNKKVYIGVTRAGNVDAEVRAVIKRPSFLIKNKNDRPISIKQCEVVIVGEVDDKVEAVLAEALLHSEIANDDDYTATDIAWSGRAKGTLTHVAGRSVVYAFGVTMRPDDKQRPSPCPRGQELKFTPAFEAEIAAATAPLDSMPDERINGDLDERMIKESKKRPVYHAYTRGPWSVHRWTKSRRAPFADEQRWLWPSADDARAWTQKKIDQKTSERGGYVIEDDDE